MSEEKDDQIVVTPKEGNSFYSVTIEIEEEDDKGKIKKVKEEHLVDGRNVTDVESKVHEQMEGTTMAQWKITKCQTSKIILVY